MPEPIRATKETLAFLRQYGLVTEEATRPAPPPALTTFTKQWLTRTWGGYIAVSGAVGSGDAPRRSAERHLDKLLDWAFRRGGGVEVIQPLTLDRTPPSWDGTPVSPRHVCIIVCQVTGTLGDDLQSILKEEDDG